MLVRMNRFRWKSEELSVKKEKNKKHIENESEGFQLTWIIDVDVCACEELCKWKKETLIKENQKIYLSLNDSEIFYQP